MVFNTYKDLVAYLECALDISSTLGFLISSVDKETNYRNIRWEGDKQNRADVEEDFVSKINYYLENSDATRPTVMFNRYAVSTWEISNSIRNYELRRTSEK